jgi:hypothetical protein
VAALPFLYQTRILKKFVAGNCLDRTVADSLKTLKKPVGCEIVGRLLYQTQAIISLHFGSEDQ